MQPTLVAREVVELAQLERGLVAPLVQRLLLRALLPVQVRAGVELRTGGEVLQLVGDRLSQRNEPIDEGALEVGSLA